MNNEKLCEYLSDIGVLLFDNVDLFLQMYSSQNNKQFKNEADKLKESLFLYLQKTTKNDNLLRLMSKQLIDSYYNSQAITKYKSLNNMVNILQNKLFLIYHNFIINISKYIINKNEENIFRSSQHSKKIKNTKSKSKPKKKPQRPKRTNQYKNNYYMNIQDNNINSHSYFVNNNDYYLNMYKNDLDNPYNENFNLSNNDFNNNINDENIISYKYYSPMVNIQSKKPINNYMPINNNQNGPNQSQLLINNNNINNINNYNMNNINNENISNIHPEYNNQISMQEDINNDNNNNIDYLPDDYDFFDNEQKHLQKVKNKIMNLKNERITKLEEQCTFTPQINSTYKIPKSEKSTNTFEKLYNDSSINKIKKEELIKKYLDEFKFAPNLEASDNYRIKSTFEQRRINSIQAKSQKLKNKINEEEKRIKDASSVKRKVDKKSLIDRLYNKELKKTKEKKEKEKKEKENEDKKKKVIDWKKVYKDYYTKYPEGDDYKRHLEKRKNLFESINNNKKKDDKKNNIIDFNDFLKEKENNKDNENNGNNENKDNEDNNNKDNKDNRNNDDNNKRDENEEDNKINTLEREGEGEGAGAGGEAGTGAGEETSEAFKSSALKKLLNNDN